MTTNRDFDRMARAWLDLMPDEAPDRLIANVRLAVDASPQERRSRLRAVWRPDNVKRISLIAAAAAVALALTGGVLLLTSGPEPTTSPRMSPTAPLATEAEPATAEPASVLQGIWKSSKRADITLVIEGFSAKTFGAGGATISDERITVESGVFTLLERAGASPACAAQPIVQYVFRLVPDETGFSSLPYSTSGDQCPERAAIFTASWTLVPSPTRTVGPSVLDRDRLVYGRFVDGDVKAAFMANRDGTGEHRILDRVVGDIRSLEFSPSSNRLTFVVRDTEHPDGAIWTSRWNGEGAILYYDGRVDGCDSVFHPVFSPDESRMALVCYRPEGSALAVLDVNSRRLRLLVTYRGPEFLDNPARWSGDGKLLVYDVMHFDPTNSFVDGGRIATIPADGSEAPTYLSTFDAMDARPSWLQDGGAEPRILFNTNDLSGVHTPGIASDIWVMDADGSNVELYLRASDAGVARLAQPLPDPSPDGSRVWVTALTGAGLRIAWIDAASRKLTILPIEGSEVSVR